VLATPIAEILFVDDNPGNVRRAVDAGMQAIHYVEQKAFVEQLKELMAYHKPLVE
jgi:FMN phosphatase YigB (HAD superfamily)